jgi:RimJ/RimL family protein N-acetyltransferase
MLRGQKLNIRPMSEADLELFYTWMSEQECMGDFMDADMHYKDSFIESFKKQFNDSTIFYGIIEDKNCKPLGVINHRAIRQGSGGTEIGMMIAEPECRSKGIGQEALSMFVNYIFKTKPFFRIQYHTRVDNISMKTIGEKIGFTVEGILRNYSYNQGAYRDHYIIAITREDWLNER